MPGRDEHHFPMIRRMLQLEAEEVDPAVVDLVPAGCRNSIRWHLGHALWSSEWLLLTLSNLPTTYPSKWQFWFGPGTSPADFAAATPDWPALLAALRVSTERLDQYLLTFDPEAELIHPMISEEHRIDVHTAFAAAIFAAGHEGCHYGQIAAYHRILTASHEPRRP